MNRNHIEGNWKTFSGKTKDQWGKPINDRLDVIAAKRDQLEGEIQQAYRIIKDAAEKHVREFEEIKKH